MSVNTLNQESQEIMKKLRDLKPRLREEMGITRLRVFGSVARGEAEPDSDVDLIVEFDKKPGLMGFCGFQHDIGEHLGKKVDMFLENELHRALKDKILSEARDV